jgi:hypothetical protein
MAARFLAALAFVCLYGSPAFSRPSDCANFQVWRDALENNYGEVRTHAGISQSNQVVIELFENPETHSFTVIVTDPYGVSCPIVGGEYWSTVDPRPGL